MTVVSCGSWKQFVEPDYRMSVFSDVGREAKLVSSAGKGRTYYLPASFMGVTHVDMLLLTSRADMCAGLCRTSDNLWLSPRKLVRHKNAASCVAQVVVEVYKSFLLAGECRRFVRYLFHHLAEVHKPLFGPCCLQFLAGPDTNFCLD